MSFTSGGRVCARALTSTRPAIAVLAAVCVTANVAAPADASPARAAVARRAPILAVHGDRLTWTRNPRIHTYMLMRKVPGRATRYSVIHGTSISPPPVPGVTVDYSVRTAAKWSTWSAWKRITYAAPSDPSLTPSPAQATPSALQPALTSEVAPSYPSQPAKPQSPQSPQTPTTPEQPPAPDSNFQPGLTSGTNMKEDLQGAALLGAKLVRVGWSIATTPQEMEPVIAGYASEGIRVQPLAEFYGRTPSPAEAQSLAGWARAFGPGGTFWTGRSDAQLAIKAIEFGNETDSGEQYGTRAGDPSYTTLAENYATRLREAAQAVAATGTGVGLLAQDDDESGDWMRGMYAAVPDLTSFVTGWTIHPYGGEQYNRERLALLLAQTAEHGAGAIPIDITEWGVSTDNGDCVNFNEGLNPCMSYEEAAQTLNSTVAWIGRLLGQRLGDFFLYQVRDQQPAGKTDNWQDYFGVLQHELQPKGAYTAAAESFLSS